jgi:transposase-like protein
MLATDQAQDLFFSSPRTHRILSLAEDIGRLRKQLQDKIAEFEGLVLSPIRAPTSSTVADLLRQSGAVRKGKRRSFTDDFKAKAVAMVVEEGKNASQVARELGLTESAFRRWIENDVTGGRKKNGTASKLASLRATIIARLKTGRATTAQLMALPGAKKTTIFKTLSIMKKAKEIVRFKDGANTSYELSKKMAGEAFAIKSPTAIAAAKALQEKIAE